MNTKLLTSNNNDLKTAADIIRSGGTVVFPTETVYGIGADALKPEAVKKIFEAKGRPADNPLIVHVWNKEQINDIAAEIPAGAKLLIDKFMPGPLTVILKRRPEIPDVVTAGLNTVGIRMPENKIAARFLELANCPVAAPSANLSGKPSPTRYEHCVDDMNGRVGAIIDGGDCNIGIESTVIDMSGDPVIYRPGDVSREQIEKVLGAEVKVAVSVQEGEKPKSPGLKYKHYSPNGRVVVLRGGLDDVINCINSQSEKCGVILFDEILKEIESKLKEGVHCVSLGGIDKPEEAATELFAALRDMDKFGAEIIFAPEIPDSDKWAGVRNRLYRAAGNEVYDAAEFASHAVDSDANERQCILFVCTGNTCRSPMAEGLFNCLAKESGLNYTAKSAGLFVMPGSKVSQNSVTAMAEEGIDISGHIPAQINLDLINESDLILTMSESHKQAIQTVAPKATVCTLSEYAGEESDISDPFGGSEQVYRECGAQIKDRIEKIIKRLQDD